NRKKYYGFLIDISLSHLYRVALDIPNVFAIFARGWFSTSKLIRLFLSSFIWGLPMPFPAALALAIPSLVRCTNISRSLSATHVSIPIMSFLTLGSVLCRKVSLEEHEIRGAYSSIAFIESKVSQKVLPILESS